MNKVSCYDGIYPDNGFVSGTVTRITVPTYL